MTKQEVDMKRGQESLGLLRRSGVGYISALNSLTPATVDLIRTITLSGSDSEAMVKMALQFAFQHAPEFKAYIVAQAYQTAHNRDFRVVR